MSVTEMQGGIEQERRRGGEKGREREREAQERDASFIGINQEGGEKRRVCGETTVHVSHVHIRACVHVPRDALRTCVIMGNVALISLHAGFPCLSLCCDTACTSKTHIYTCQDQAINHVQDHVKKAKRLYPSPQEKIYITDFRREYGTDVTYPAGCSLKTSWERTEGTLEC